jgi:fucose permease
MPVLGFFGAFFFLVPLTAAFLAKRLGRSFAIWFGIGCVLPIVAVFILLLLPEKKEALTEIKQ